MVDIRVRPVILGLPIYVRGTKQYPIIPAFAERPALAATQAVWRWVAGAAAAAGVASLLFAEFLRGVRPAARRARATRPAGGGARERGPGAAGVAEPRRLQGRPLPRPFRPDDGRNPFRRLYAAKRRDILEIAGSRPGRVLDFGGGPGRIAVPLARGPHRHPGGHLPRDAHARCAGRGRRSARRERSDPDPARRPRARSPSPPGASSSPSPPISSCTCPIPPRRSASSAGCSPRAGGCSSTRPTGTRSGCSVTQATWGDGQGGGCERGAPGGAARSGPGS